MFSTEALFRSCTWCSQTWNIGIIIGYSTLVLVINRCRWYPNIPFLVMIKTIRVISAWITKPVNLRLVILTPTSIVLFAIIILFPWGMAVISLNNRTVSGTNRVIPSSHQIWEINLMRVVIRASRIIWDVNITDRVHHDACGWNRWTIRHFN